MKLIFAIVNSEDSSAVAKSLTKNGFFATKLASTGGFLSSGNTTFLICTENEKVDPAIKLIKDQCSNRRQVIEQTIPGIATESFNTIPMEINTGGATIFVTDVERFEKV